MVDILFMIFRLLSEMEFARYPKLPGGAAGWCQCTSGRVGGKNPGKQHALRGLIKLYLRLFETEARTREVL